MKLRAQYLWFGLGLIMAVGVPAHADDADDTKLQTEVQHIDKDKSVKTDEQKVDALAKQFNVPEATVQDLRTKGQGWGEVTIGLASAQQLTKMDPKTYPTLADALTKIEALRASGEGWGKIAKDLGFKLGPVVSAAHHTRHEWHETLRTEKAEHHEGMEKSERGEHMDRPAHPDHPDHPDHPEMPDRPGH